MKVFVTGASGCLASVLLPALCSKSDVEQVTGIDINPSAFSDKKYQHTVIDMRDDKLKALMEGHDAVVHLAFAVTQDNLSDEEMHSVNVDGSKNVIDAACSNGIEKFINMSSISVYGSGENMTEAKTPQPPAWFPYAHHKLAVEKYLQQHIPNATIFRAHLIVGKKAQQFLRELFILPVWIDFGSHPPKQQVVHEDDVVEALITSLDQDVAGFYNLAAPDIIELGGNYVRKGQEEGRKIRRMPFWLVRSMAKLGRLFMKKDLLTLIAMLDTTSTANCDKAARDLGWKPLRSAWDARVDALKSLDTN